MIHMIDINKIRNKKEEVEKALSKRMNWKILIQMNFWSGIKKKEELVL